MINTEVLKKELQSKQRSINDLFRYINTKNDENPNYSLFLGAGCSVTSGIRSGSQLIQDWRYEIYKQELLSQNHNELECDENNTENIIEYLSNKCATWYNKNNEYSSLFEKQYDTPRQRRMFVEKEVSNKKPSIGYAYLMRLIEGSFFKTIFTTNFDDLINEAFYQFSEQRPMLCSHDSSIKSITVTSKRPKIIKLHGDYLYDDIKSTLRETESLEDNIRNKFIEFAKDYGLIVVGYGGNDRSIMDVLNYLLKLEDYYKHGIYWCLREGDYVSEELRKLLRKENVYFVLVEGFDELFAELYSKVYGDQLPISTNFISNKSQEIIDSFINNTLSNKTNSLIIQKDLQKLKHQNEKNNLYEVIKELQSNKDFGDGKFDNKEIKLIFELENLYQQHRYEEMLQKMKFELEKTNNKYLKINLLKKSVSVYIQKENIVEANSLLDKLIIIDAKNPIHLLKKAEIAKEYDQKIALLDQAISLDPYDDNIINKKISYIIEQDQDLDEHDTVQSIILNLLEQSIQINPSIDNDAWGMKFKFLRTKNEKDPRLEEIVRTLKQQNPYSSLYLNLKYNTLNTEEEKKNYINELEDIKNKFSDEKKIIYELLILNILDEINDKKNIRLKLDILNENKLHYNNEIVIRRRIELLVSKFNELDKAIEEAKRLFKLENNKKNLKILIEYLLYGNFIEEAQNILNNNELLLKQKERLELQRDIYEQEKKYDKAYEISQRICELNNITEQEKNFYLGQAAYQLIQLRKYSEAKSMLKDLLQKKNFSYKEETLIINYELINKSQGNVPNKNRLDKVFSKTKDTLVKAAIKILEDKTNDALAYIKETLQKDFSRKYNFQDWPIFEPLHDSPKYQEYIAKVPS